MKFDSQSQAIGCLLQAMPYPNQIKDIDLSYAPAVYFTWRSGRYKIELETASVDRCENHCLIGDDCSILLRTLLQQRLIKILIEK